MSLSSFLNNTFIHYHLVHTETSVQSSSSSVVVDGLEPYPSTKRPRHPSSDSMEKLRPKGSIADVSKKGRNHMHHPSSDLDSDPDVANDSSDIPSDHTRSTSAFRPRPKKRSRSTRSAPNLYRKSSHRPPSRRKPPTIEEYDSPPSDFYLQEDLQRRTSRMNTRARSEYWSTSGRLWSRDHRFAAFSSRLHLTALHGCW